MSTHHDDVLRAEEIARETVDDYDDADVARIMATVRALRALQVYDELTPASVPNRYLLIEAETALGEVLGLGCTGEADGWNEDGSVAFYSHNGDTCPVHEWLVPDDHPATERG